MVLSDLMKNIRLSSTLWGSKAELAGQLGHVGQGVGQQLLQDALPLSSRLWTSSHRSSRMVWDVLDRGFIDLQQIRQNNVS